MLRQPICQHAAERLESYLEVLVPNPVDIGRIMAPILDGYPCRGPDEPHPGALDQGRLLEMAKDHVCVELSRLIWMGGPDELAESKGAICIIEWLKKRILGDLARNPPEAFSQLCVGEILIALLHLGMEYSITHVTIITRLSRKEVKGRLMNATKKLGRHKTLLTDWQGLGI
jgi:hypothetical protein